VTIELLITGLIIDLKVRFVFMLTFIQMLLSVRL